MTGQIQIALRGHAEAIERDDLTPSQPVSEAIVHSTKATSRFCRTRGENLVVYRGQGNTDAFVEHVEAMSALGQKQT